MATETKNYGFIKPDINEFYDRNIDNENLDKIDEELKRIEEAAGNLDDLDTEEKTGLVAAINELKSQIGNLTNLETEEKASLVSSVNEIHRMVSEHLAESVNDGVHGMGSIASQEYEEGAWTPSLHFGGNSDGITYSSQQGRYVRIGNLVYFEMMLILSSKGTSNGVATIAGFPFSALGSPSRGYFLYDVLNINNVDSGDVLYLRHSSGSVGTFTKQVYGSGHVTDLTSSDFADNTRIILTGTYRI